MEHAAADRGYKSNILQDQQFIVTQKICFAPIYGRFTLRTEEVGLEIRLFGLEDPLKDIGEAAGGMDYTAVAMAIKRFEEKARKKQAVNHP